MNLPPRVKHAIGPKRALRGCWTTIPKSRTVREYGGVNAQALMPRASPCSLSAATCPNCGVVRQSTVRRCHTCGWDYWAAAAGAAQPPGVTDRREPELTFLPNETDVSAAQPSWWQRRSRRQKGAVFGAAALVVLYGIGTVSGNPSDAPTAAGTDRTRSPSPTAEPATPTERPTAEPTTELGAAPVGITTVARVVDVVDGDTIKVDIDGEVFTVRYIGIDTPETVDPSSPVEWMGPEASAANADLVEGQEVHLEKDVSEVDQFDRLLRYVWLEQGTAWLLVNYQLVHLGFASSVTYPPDVRYQELFLDAERAARDADSGLWAPAPTPAPTPPPTPLPTAVPTAAPTAAPPPPANCDASYPTVCIPPYPPDLDCGEIAFRRFDVLPPDPHGFDGDNDGIGCES